MINALILGSTGMAGHVITLYLERNNKLRVHNLSHQKALNSGTVVMDVCNRIDFEDYLVSNSIDVIINCIGILNRFAEERKHDAVFLNGYLPHFLEYKYRNSSTRIIHLSTDCVFSGKAGNYTESSFKDGDSFYSRTKAIGELLNGKDLTFRTSIIGPDLNPDGIGMFNWFMKSSGEINGYANVMWTGITTIELAKAVENAIFSGLAGLYHLVPQNRISKFDLLNLFKEKFRRDDITIKKDEHTHCVDKSLIDTQKNFKHIVPAYENMLEEMKQWISINKHLYPHYIYNKDKRSENE